MKIICRPLRAGKTTEAIKWANETGAYLICINEQEKKRIREECNRNPVSFSELNQYGMQGSFVRNVVVDNFDIYFEQRLEDALRHVFAPLHGLKVEAVTFTESPEEISKRVMKKLLREVGYKI